MNPSMWNLGLSQNQQFTLLTTYKQLIEKQTRQDMIKKIHAPCLTILGTS